MFLSYHSNIFRMHYPNAKQAQADYAEIGACVFTFTRRKKSNRTSVLIQLLSCESQIYFHTAFEVYLFIFNDMKASLLDFTSSSDFFHVYVHISPARRLKVLTDHLNWEARLGSFDP